MKTPTLRYAQCFLLSALCTCDMMRQENETGWEFLMAFEQKERLVFRFSGFRLVSALPLQRKYFQIFSKPLRKTVVELSKCISVFCLRPFSL